MNTKAKKYLATAGMFALGTALSMADGLTNPLDSGASIDLISAGLVTVAGLVTGFVGYKVSVIVIRKGLAWLSGKISG